MYADVMHMKTISQKIVRQGRIWTYIDAMLKVYFTMFRLIT